MTSPQPQEIPSNASPPTDESPLEHTCRWLCASLESYFWGVEWTPITRDDGVEWHCFDTRPGPSGVGLFLGLIPEKGGWSLDDLGGRLGGVLPFWAATLAGAAVGGFQVASEWLERHDDFAELLCVVV